MYMHGNETTDSLSGSGSGLKGKGKAVILRARTVDAWDHFETCSSKYAFYTVKANAAQICWPTYESLD